MIISALPSAWLLLVSQPDTSVTLTEQQPALCSTVGSCLARAQGCFHRGWTTLHSQPFLGDELKNCLMPRWPAGLGLPWGPAFGFVGCLLELALAGCCTTTGVPSGPLAGSSAAPSGSSGQPCHKVRDACDWCDLHLRSPAREGIHLVQMAHGPGPLLQLGRGAVV